MTAPRPDARTASAFALAVVLGSANFVAVRYSNTELAPLWGAALRFSVAASVLAVLVVALRLRWPSGTVVARMAGYGVLGFGACYGLLYWALTDVTAGVATTVLAAVPLVTLLLAVGAGMERLRGRAVGGAVLTVLGIAVMAAGGGALPGPQLLALVVAVVAVSSSVVLAKRLSTHHPVVVNAVGMASGAAVLLVASALHGDAWVLPRSSTVAWAVGYLVLPGSVGMFLLILLVVRAWTPSASSYAFVLFPAVTMLLGALLADEPVTPRLVLGALVVMAGVWLGALSGRPPAPPVPAQPGPVDPATDRPRSTA